MFLNHFDSIIVSFTSSLCLFEPPTGVTVHATPNSNVTLNYITPPPTHLVGNLEPNIMALHQLNNDGEDKEKKSNEEEKATEAATIACSRNCKHDAMEINLNINFVPEK